MRSYFSHTDLLYVLWCSYNKHKLYFFSIIWFLRRASPHEIQLSHFMKKENILKHCHIRTMWRHQFITLPLKDDPDTSYHRKSTLCVFFVVSSMFAFIICLCVCRRFSPAQETCYWTLSLMVPLALRWRVVSLRSTLWRSWSPLTSQSKPTDSCRASPTPGSVLSGH